MAELPATDDDEAYAALREAAASFVELVDDLDDDELLDECEDAGIDIDGKSTDELQQALVAFYAARAEAELKPSLAVIDSAQASLQALRVEDGNGNMATAAPATPARRVSAGPMLPEKYDESKRSIQSIAEQLAGALPRDLDRVPTKASSPRPGPPKPSIPPQPGSYFAVSGIHGRHVAARPPSRNYGGRSRGVFGTLTYPHLIVPYLAYYGHLASIVLWGSLVLPYTLLVILEAFRGI